MNPTYFKILNTICVFIFVFVVSSNYTVLNKYNASSVDMELKVVQNLQTVKLKFQERFRELREAVKSYCKNPPTEQIANAIQ